MTKSILSLSLNGARREDAVADNMLLIDYLREVANLTGTKMGCDGGECGACTVLIDGKARPACITLAATCDGRAVETVEGLARNGRLSALQRAFHERLGVQCGFCTPGMIMAAVDMIERYGGKLDEKTVREELEGNICRCTGYHNIVKAILAAADQMAGLRTAAE